MSLHKFFTIIRLTTCLLMLNGQTLTIWIITEISPSIKSTLSIYHRSSTSCTAKISTIFQSLTLELLKDLIKTMKLMMMECQRIFLSKLEMAQRFLLSKFGQMKLLSLISLILMLKLGGKLGYLSCTRALSLMVFGWT